MKEIIISPESLPASAFFSIGGEAGYRPQSYVDFRHAIRGGGTIIFHNTDEQESAAAALEGMATLEGGDKKHFLVAANITNEARYRQALDALEVAGFKAEKANDRDYKLEEKTRQAH